MRNFFFCNPGVFHVVGYASPLLLRNDHQTDVGCLLRVHNQPANIISGEGQLAAETAHPEHRSFRLLTDMRYLTSASSLGLFLYFQP